MQNLNSYIARSIIRHLNEDYEEFERLKRVALEIYEHKKHIAKIGDIIPKKTKEKMYQLVN